MRCVTADEVEGFDDLTREFVEVPEWGQAVGLWVREMTIREYHTLIDRYGETGTKPGYMEELVAMCAVDENGRPIFDASNMDQMAMLSGKSHAAIMRIADAVNEINGLTATAQATIEGNSESP